MVVWEFDGFWTGSVEWVRAELDVKCFTKILSIKRFTKILSVKHLTTFCLRFYSWPTNLQQNKHSEMCQIFSWKHFTVKQMKHRWLESFIAFVFVFLSLFGIFYCLGWSVFTVKWTKHKWLESFIAFVFVSLFGIFYCLGGSAVLAGYLVRKVMMVKVENVGHCFFRPFSIIFTKFNLQRPIPYMYFMKIKNLIGKKLLKLIYGFRFWIMGEVRL